MISAMHSALSGVAAYAKQIEVSAHNVANVNTDGFKKSQTDLVEGSNGGVRPVVRKDDSAGPTVLSDRGHGPTQVELSNVNLADEAVTQIIAQRGFEANISTLRTADDMLGTILDMKR
ncbi:MAG: flagellar basal body protein [Nitrospirae bacterium]|nr:flagellar basal body protein [Nitrospirota bacterium]